MSIVDISKKPVVHRLAIAKAVLYLRSRPIFTQDELERVCEQAVKTSWLFLPLLHPVPITATRVKMKCAESRLELVVEAETSYKTGVEMDVLFGLAACICHIASRLDNPENIHVEQIRVEEKLKQAEAREQSYILFVRIPERVSKLRVEPKEELVEIECRGSLRVKTETVRVIKEGRVEKGNVVEFSRMCALENTKRVIALLDLDQAPLITGADCVLSLGDNEISLLLRIRGQGDLRSLSAACLFGTLCGLLCVWDMVKKYEKDERGQYPVTEVRNVFLKVMKTAPA